MCSGEPLLIYRGRRLCARYHSSGHLRLYSGSKSIVPAFKVCFCRQRHHCLLCLICFDLACLWYLSGTLNSPRQFLDSLDALLGRNGFVVFVSPYSWLTEYTDKPHWLGGFHGGGSTTEPVWSADALRCEVCPWARLNEEIVACCYVALSVDPSLIILPLQ